MFRLLPFKRLRWIKLLAIFGEGDAAVAPLKGKRMTNSYSECLTDTQVEDYAFGRVSAEAIADVEEHLMVCSRCQDRLQDEEEYIAAFRQSVRVAQRPVQWYKPLAAAACLVMAVGLWIPFAGTKVDDVDLRAERGSMLAPSAQAQAGHKVALNVDLAGLESRKVASLQIVTEAGVPLAEKKLDQKQELAKWSVNRKLQAGTYWVRAYDAAGTQLREFKLDVK